MQADLASARPVASWNPHQLGQNSWCPKQWIHGWLISSLFLFVFWQWIGVCFFFSGDIYDDVDLLMPFVIAESLLITFLFPDFWMKPLRCVFFLEPSIVVSLNPNVLHGGWAPNLYGQLGSSSHFLSISGLKKSNWWFQPNPPEKWLSSSDWIIIPTRKGFQCSKPCSKAPTS